MAPHQRISTLWPCLLMVLLPVDVCSAREVQALRSVFTGHTKFAKEHRLLDVTPGKKSASTHEFGDFEQLSKSSENKVGSGGNHFYVSKTGNANFNRIQDAIDSIPEYNKQWVQIDIAAGVYQ